MIYLPKYTGPRLALQSKIGEGPKAVVLRLSADYVVKLRKTGWPIPSVQDDSAVTYALSSECDLLRELHRRKISVPQPLGAYRVPIQTLDFPWPLPKTFFNERMFPGLVMEHIPGIFIEQAPIEKQTELERRALEEVSKAIIIGLNHLQEGFDPAKNAMWVPETDRVYVVGWDFLLPSFRKSPQGVLRD